MPPIVKKMDDNLITSVPVSDLTEQLWKKITTSSKKNIEKAFQMLMFSLNALNDVLKEAWDLKYTLHCTVHSDGGG